MRAARNWSRPRSGLSRLNDYRIPERGARIPRRDDQGYRAYLRHEQRREAGGPARQTVLEQCEQSTGMRQRTFHP